MLTSPRNETVVLSLSGMVVSFGLRLVESIRANAHDSGWREDVITKRVDRVVGRLRVDVLTISRVPHDRTKCRDQIRTALRDVEPRLPVPSHRVRQQIFDDGQRLPPTFRGGFCK